MTDAITQQVYSRQTFNRLVMQRDMAAYIQQKRAQATEAVGQASDGENV